MALPCRRLHVATLTFSIGMLTLISHSSSMQASSYISRGNLPLLPSESKSADLWLSSTELLRCSNSYSLSSCPPSLPPIKYCPIIYMYLVALRTVCMSGNNPAVTDLECLNCWNAIYAVGAARHYIARIQGQPINTVSHCSLSSCMEDFMGRQFNGCYVYVMYSCDRLNCTKIAAVVH